MLTLLLLTGAQAGDLTGLVDPKGRPESPIVAFIEGEGPALPPLDATRVIQRGKRFHPRGVYVSVGTVIEFGNQDVFFHHVFSRSGANDFEIDEYGKGEVRNWTARAPGRIDVQCKIHDEMRAEIMVLPNAWYAEADDEGRFILEGVSPGERTLVVWSQGYEMWRETLTVPERGTVELDRIPLKRAPLGLVQVPPSGVPGDGY